MVQRQLTITIDELLYVALQDRVGPENISAFIEELVRPVLVTDAELEAGYLALAADEEGERDAQEWADGLIGDSAP